MKPQLESPFLDGEWWRSEDGTTALAQAEASPAAQPVPDSAAIPLRWICRIFVQRRVVHAGGRVSKTGLAPAGSGMLISPRHVLTVAHVLSAPEDAAPGEQHEMTLVTVLPGAAAAGTANERFPAARWDLHPRWRVDARGTASDLALITLEQPIGRRAFDRLRGQPLGCWGSTPGHGWLADMPAALAARAFDLPLRTAGFPHSARGQMVGSESQPLAEPAHRRQLERDGLVAAWWHASPVMMLAAGATKGQSGSPVWVEDQGRRYLVGVVVEAASDRNHALVLGAPAQRLVQDWIAGRGATERESEADVEEGSEHDGADAEASAAAAAPARAAARLPEEGESFADGEAAPEPELGAGPEAGADADFEDELTRAQAKATLAQAIAGGERDETRLANRVFFARHPERDPTRPLDPQHDPADRAAAAEWTRIRDGEVWAAIQAAAEDPDLKVRGEHAANGHREFWGADGQRFKGLVDWAANETGLHAGLLAAALVSETGGRRSYLLRGPVSSYHVGVDDFYAMRHVLQQHVPAYAKVGWNRQQTPQMHLNDAQSRQREVQTILFNSGRDALLATAVYLKYAEVRLRSDAAKAGGDFDRLPPATRLALIRMSMAAGRAGAERRLQHALKGEDILVRNWKPPRAYQTDRNATIRAAQALHFERWFFAPATATTTTAPGPAPVPAGVEPESGAPEVFVEPGFEMEEAHEAFDDAELEHLGVLEHDTPPPAAAKPATLGFEFDLNHGFEDKVVDAMGLGPPPGWEWPREALQATDHEGRDGSGRLADGFAVTMDAVRLEIATEPVRVDDDAEFKAVVANVLAFGRELQAAEKTLQRDTTVPGVGGHPLLLFHPRTVVNQPERRSDGSLAFPGDRKHAKYRREVVPLVVHRLFGRYPTSGALWASPQATLTLPLAEFGKLVWEIHRTMGAAPGEALTGPASARLGLRDDLAWTALKIAMAERKRRVGSTLPDGSTITETMFSRALTSLLTILIMYLLTGVEVDPRDAAAREFYAKGSLPLNLKTPLWAVHRHALNADEKRVLHALYTGPGRRETLFALVPRRPPGKGDTPLFPSRTEADTRRWFDAPPSWRTLVDALVEEQPVKVTKENSLEKKGHRKGDEILIAPLSSKIDWDRTQPRIAVELRRIGFAPVGFAQWGRLMERVRALARSVNP